MTIDWLDLEGLGEEALYANSDYAVTFKADHMGVSLTERYHSASKPDATLELDRDDWRRISDRVIGVMTGEDASSVDDGMATAEAIAAECDALAALLKRKNAAYGDSLTNPVRIFSKADRMEQINVRLDDKMSRIIRGDDAGEDAELDLLGYLVMKRVCKRLGG